MKISNRLTAIVLSALAALSTMSCDKPAPVEPEDNGNSFTYEGNTYKVRSVVLYELENNMTQIWMSETAGYTTVDEIEASVGELVLTIQTKYIGNGKQSDNIDETKPGNLIRYDGKRNSGYYTFTCNKDESTKTITIEFSSQNLKSSAKNAIEGSYSGPYTEYTLAELENQWAYNRAARDITGVDYFEMEDGEPSRLVIYENEIPAVEVTINKGSIGTGITIPNKDNPLKAVHFDDGEEFDLSKSHGKVTITPKKDEQNIFISLKLTNDGGKTLAANYTGPYRHRYGNKANRAIFDSGRSVDLDGKFTLNSMQVTETATGITFRFTPGSHIDEKGRVDMVNIPTLKISKSLVNKGDVNIDTTPHPWEFTYNSFQVFSSDESNPERPTASSGSILNVECDNNGNYTINLEVTHMITKLEYRDVVDENGNPVTEEVPKVENGLPVFNEDGTPAMVEQIKQEQVEILVPESMDLYFSQAN